MMGVQQWAEKAKTSERTLQEVRACLQEAMQYIEYHTGTTRAERESDSRWARWRKAATPRVRGAR